MRLTPAHWLTEPRRAGLLAAVAVYPLTRLAGTVPRPVLDRGLVSGTTMAFAYTTGSTVAGVVRKAAGQRAASGRRGELRVAAVSLALAAGAGAVAAGLRHRARALARERERLPVSTASAQSAAEVVALAGAAGAVIAGVDSIGGHLPDGLHPGHPAMMAIGVVAAGVGATFAVRNPRVQAYLSIPPADGTGVEEAHFLRHRNLPVAAAGSAAIAAVALGALRLETWSAEALARALDATPNPGPVAELASQAIVAAGLVAAGLAGYTTYSSRVQVKQRALESAYAAVPGRHGVTGGPDSGLAFADLGREGRRFISQAYTADELSTVLGRPAADPVRAWVPVTALTGDDDQDAALVVAEVERLGGFAKGTIVLAAPTGDGYVSYVQTETVELLTAGDCTTVAVGYSVLPSALAITRRAKASAAYATYARALAARARELNPDARLYSFGESLGSIIALDAFGPDVVRELSSLGFSGGLYVGVPIFSRTDQALRPRDPAVRESNGVQYATGREQAHDVRPGFLNLTHATDPVGLADVSSLVRHTLDYWGTPKGIFVPLVSFLVHLADVKNAMSLRPGEFRPSPGHDYRYDTALAVARAYDLPFDQEELVETALRERELAWSVRRLLARRLGEARDAVVRQMRGWGVDPATLTTRFAGQRRTIPGWVDALIPPDDTRFADSRDDAPA